VLAIAVPDPEFRNCNLFTFHRSFIGLNQVWRTCHRYLIQKNKYAYLGIKTIYRHNILRHTKECIYVKEGLSS
jgi:hypothetical protein